MVTIRKISRVLGMRLYHNLHIRAVMRYNIRSGIRHSAIGEVWPGIILVGRGKRVAWTFMLLTRMRRGRLHRHVVRGMVRGSLTGLMRSWNRRILPIDRKRVSDRPHERGGWRGATTGGHTGKRHTHRWRGRWVGLSIGGGCCATLSIALLVRASLNTLFSFLALGIDALFADTVLDAAEAGARVVALLTRLLTVRAGVLDLTTLGTNLRLGGADHTWGKWVHVHWQTSVRHGMDGQLRLDRVGSGFGGLIDSVIVGVSTDGSHS